MRYSEKPINRKVQKVNEHSKLAQATIYWPFVTTWQLTEDLHIYEFEEKMIYLKLMSKNSNWCIILTLTYE